MSSLGSNPDDGSTLDAAALPAIIDGLRARGYGFVTLQAMTGQNDNARHPQIQSTSTSF
jgi:hypothetical protein